MNTFNALRPSCCAALAVCAAAFFSGLPGQAQTMRPAAPHSVSGVTARDVPNFAVVAPGIYRGAAPTAEGMKKLKALGVRTIIDLRIEKKGQDEEAAQAKALGMNRVRIRMGREAPTKKQTAQFLSLVNAASPQNPIFIHCQHGADRTGAMVGIWRRTHNKWAFEPTYAEMRKYGFKPFLHELKGAVAACDAR